ncbi:hypothetical protein JOD67_000380 [Tenggerimyces flavus]|nr:hypothetical protein [Tenggerimyces flavus]
MGTDAALPGEWVLYAECIPRKVANDHVNMIIGRHWGVAREPSKEH